MVGAPVILLAVGLDLSGALDAPHEIGGPTFLLGAVPLALALLAPAPCWRSRCSSASTTRSGRAACGWPLDPTAPPVATAAVAAAAAAAGAADERPSHPLDCSHPPGHRRDGMPL